MPQTASIEAQVRPFVNTAALRLNRSDALTVANAISGTGTLTQAGTGTTTLTGANTYTGATVVNGGGLSFVYPMSSSALTLANGTTNTITSRDSSWTNSVTTKSSS